jgi:cbb3-type cytochrome oxidase subunit 3
MSTFIRSFITVFLFSSFIVLWYSAWRKGGAGHYDAAARLPLEDTDAAGDRSTPRSTDT